MANQDLKLYAAGKGVKQWQIAELFGQKPSNFSMSLRSEWPDEKKSEYRAAVDKLASDRNTA